MQSPDRRTKGVRKWSLPILCSVCLVPLPTLTPAEEVRRFEHKGPVHQAFLSSDGRHLATTSSGGSVLAWDTASGSNSTLFEGDDGEMFCGFFVDSKTLMLFRFGDPLFRIWEKRDGQWRKARDMRVVPQEPCGLVVPGFSSDGTAMYVASGRWKEPLKKEKNEEEHQTVIEKWDWATGQRVPFAFPSFAHSVTGVVPLPDGKTFLVSTFNKVVAVDLPSGQKRYSVDLPGFGGVSVSPDGQYVRASFTTHLMVPDGHRELTIRLWRTSKHKDTRAIEGLPPGTASPVFSPDSRFLLFVTRDKKIEVYDVEKAVFRPPLPQPREMEGVQFLASGELVAVGIEENVVTYWPVANGNK